MNTARILSTLAGALVASVTLAGNAFAKDYGFDTNAAERARISQGMTQDQVANVVGQPAQVKRYARDPDTTWVFEAGDSTIRPKDARFLVNFGRDGKVSSTQVIDLTTN